MRSLKIFIFCLCANLVIWCAPSARAQSIIRDTEIENTFKEWMAPLLDAANMGPESVNLILVQSPSVNAFVAGGANIFIYTGLIEKSDTPEEIIGVMAHELGHITGGHLIRSRDAMERASYESILGTVLGIGAAILSGQGGAAGAVIQGTNSMAQMRYLAHSRVNESSADQAALKFLEHSEINPRGLKTFLQKLQSEEFLPRNRQSEYVRTHPLTGNRIDALENKIQSSAFVTSATPRDWNEQHARMQAKLTGFIDPGRVQWEYNDSDLSVPARYARAIAYYRENQVAKALREIDQLIEIEPRNPYFKELKGQMLVAFGRIEDALPYYREAIETAPGPSLIRIELGKALTQSQASKVHITEAITVLERALIDEPRSTRAHRLLATAYGRLNNEPMAKLHLAQEAVLQRRYPYARRLAHEAYSTLEKDSREHLQAYDLLEDIENLEKQRK